MAKSYIHADRDQQFLLPPDMREWLPPGHLVWLIADIVQALDTSAFHGRRKRRATADSNAGRRGYDPDMMLVLLFYAYCVGERSSRMIERRCHTDVAFRVACAQHAPDHTVIARFRKDQETHFTSLLPRSCSCVRRQGWSRSGPSPSMAPRSKPTPVSMRTKPKPDCERWRARSSPKRLLSMIKKISTTQAIRLRRGCSRGPLAKLRSLKRWPRSRKIAANDPAVQQR
ncbi:hypothetical protein BFL43_05975 [Williamsia sp. 1135]|nr:hypothetical protein BFL43_18700 [Williamsia sp. 1135]ORM32462.1 hypothetical protein BFL43_15435 [Williamsia sp. 1135]ORM36904.1 hypothetical protein BFL43_05975 [Williamsia sp. 1135]